MITPSKRRRKRQKTFGQKVIATSDFEVLYKKVTWILEGYGYSPEKSDVKRADGWFHLLMLVARDFIPDHKAFKAFDLFGRGGPGRPMGTKKWDDVRLACLWGRYFQIKDKRPNLNDEKICAKILKGFPDDYPNEDVQTLRRNIAPGRRAFQRVFSRRI